MADATQEQARDTDPVPSHLRTSQWRHLGRLGCFGNPSTTGLHEYMLITPMRALGLRLSRRLFVSQRKVRWQGT
jgi:hypothetical protein